MMSYYLSFVLHEQQISKQLYYNLSFSKKKRHSKTALPFSILLSINRMRKQ